MVVERVRAAEDVHQIDRLGEVGQVGAEWLAPERVSEVDRVDRQDPVAVPVEVVRHVVGGQSRLELGAEHCHHPRASEDLGRRLVAGEDHRMAATMSEE